LSHCHARAWARTGTAFGVAFGQHPPTKSAQHTFSSLCHAEGWQEGARACVSAGAWASGTRSVR
jgi:hypothetical protein